MVMRTLVVGSGAVGSVIASKCASAPGTHARVTLLGRSPPGPGIPPEVVCVSALPLGDAYDVAVFCTKAQDVYEAARQLRCGRDGVRIGIAVSLCNGIEGKDELQRAFHQMGGDGGIECLSGVTYLGAAKQQDGSVLQTGVGPTIAQRPISKSLPRLFDDWQWTDADDVTGMLWRKLLVNSVINPITALARVSNGAVFKHPDRAVVAQRLCDEFMLVAERRNVDMGLTSGASPIDVCRTVCETTSRNTSSMLADVLQGRRTEVDFITGAVLRQAAIAGLPPPPTHELMLRLVRSLEPAGLQS